MLRRILTHKRTRKTCHIYQMLKTNTRKPHLSFHTPGHKYTKWDITELSFSDNLSNPVGCIAAAQNDCAKLLGASACFFLTDGSTSGIFSMLFASKLLGVKTLLIPDAAHKSVENACAVFGLGVTRFSNIERIPAMLKHVDALLLVSPTYYGEIPDLAKLQSLCKQEDKLFLIDGAHGGHLHFDTNLYAGEYADLWVDGVHKSLPALTQGAVVCAKTEHAAKALEQAVGVFRTTSPSYPVLASVEYAVKYPRNVALEKAALAFAKEYPRVEVCEDWTKICVKFGKNAFTAQAQFERLGIYPEFCDGEYVVFYLSPSVKKRAFARLKSALIKGMKKYPYIPNERIPAPVFLQTNGETEWVTLQQSVAMVCAEDCGLFPPCTPLLRRGQRIEKEHVAALQNAVSTYGLKEGKICVFKTEF